MPVMSSGGEVMIERTPRAEAEAVACPYLGLLEDQRTRFAFATPAHRCHVKRKPWRVDLDHQGRYCLSSEFTACPRFRAPAPNPAAPRQGARSRDSKRQKPVLSVVETSRPVVDALNPVVTAESRPVPSILKPVPEPVPEEDGLVGSSAEPVAQGTLRRLGFVLMLALAVAAFAIIGYALGVLPSVDLLTVSTTARP